MSVCQKDSVINASTRCSGISEEISITLSRPAAAWIDAHEKLVEPCAGGEAFRIDRPAPSRIGVFTISSADSVKRWRSSRLGRSAAGDRFGDGIVHRAKKKRIKQQPAPRVTRHAERRSSHSQMMFAFGGCDASIFLICSHKSSWRWRHCDLEFFFPIGRVVALS